jgi:hypothetical protein
MNSLNAFRSARSSMSLNDMRSSSLVVLQLCSALGYWTTPAGCPSPESQSQSSCSDT